MDGHAPIKCMTAQQTGPRAQKTWDWCILGLKPRVSAITEYYYPLCLPARVKLVTGLDLPTQQALLWNRGTCRWAKG